MVTNLLASSSGSEGWKLEARRWKFWGSKSLSRSSSKRNYWWVGRNISCGQTAEGLKVSRKEAKEKAKSAKEREKKLKARSFANSSFWMAKDYVDLRPLAVKQNVYAMSGGLKSGVRDGIAGWSFFLSWIFWLLFVSRQKVTRSNRRKIRWKFPIGWLSGVS